MCNMFAAGVGSIPTIASLVTFMFSAIASGTFYDALTRFIMKGYKTMKIILMLLAIGYLGSCGDMV